MKSGVWLALATAAVLTALWDSPAILPFKLLVVLVHEMWHGLISLASGARVDRIILHTGETGETLVTGLRGAWAVAASVSAGYLGSALTGVLLLRRGLLESFERMTLSVFALVILYMTALYCAPGSMAFTTGIGWGIGLFVAVVAGEKTARAGLLIVGTVFLWYSFFDLFDFTRDIKRTDAGILARFLKSHADIPWSVTTIAAAVSFAWTAIMMALVYAFIGTTIIHRPVGTPAPIETPPGPEGVAPAAPVPLAPIPPPAPLPVPIAGAPVPAPPADDMADLLALRDQLKQG